MMKVFSKLKNINLESIHTPVYMPFLCLIVFFGLNYFSCEDNGYNGICLMTSIIGAPFLMFFGIGVLFNGIPFVFSIFFLLFLMNLHQLSKFNAKQSSLFIKVSAISSLVFWLNILISLFFFLS